MLLYNNVAGLRLFQGVYGTPVADWHQGGYPDLKARFRAPTGANARVPRDVGKGNRIEVISITPIGPGIG
jgi:hypothetical protein